MRAFRQFTRTRSAEVFRSLAQSAGTAKLRSLAVMGVQNVQTAVVRVSPSEPTLSISIALAGQQRSLCRAKDEPLEKALGRIHANLMPKAKKQKRGKGPSPISQEPTSIDVVLLTDPKSEISVPLETANIDAWAQGRVLKVGNDTYNIVVNPPTLEKIFVHGQAMVGIPVCALPEVQFADVEACTWQWARQEGRKWVDIADATEQVYVPQQQDQGFRLRVTCTPGRFREDGEDRVLGEPAEQVIRAVIGAPALAAGARRHLLTPTPLQPPGLRVLTYNILADQFVGTEFAKRVLFAYCPPEFREAEYRRPLILQEVLGFHADIICLQEVDEKAFVHYFQPQLSFAGFAGYYTNKAGSSREGSATFYRSDRFKCVGHQSLSLKDFFKAVWEGREMEPQTSQLLPFLEASPTLRQTMQRVSTIAQLTTLMPIGEGAKEDSPLCVVNTHLFFHPRANFIRTLHTAAIFEEASRLVQKVSEGSPDGSGWRTPALIFCGDLNSGHNKGIPGNLELMASGRLSASYWDWRSGKTFRYVKDTEEQPDDGAEGSGQDGSRRLRPSATIADADFAAGDLSLPFSLASADGLQTPFTNFVRGYQGSLDYIWYEPRRMKVKREIPLPSEDELVGWIPSKRFPSDHLSVVFDFEWLSESGGSLSSESIEGTLIRNGSRSAANLRVFPAEQKHLHHGIYSMHNRGIIAAPTDTLYGLAGDAECQEAINCIYTIKQRPQGLPLAICVASAEDIPKYGDASHLPEGLLRSLLPGPVTIILKRKANSPLAANLNPGVPTIGIRVPDSRFILQLCAHFGGAVALTSANLSGAGNPLRIEDFQALWPQCGAVYDGGEIPASPLGSTVVDLSEAQSYRLVRQGVAPEQTIAVLSNYGFQPRNS